MSFENLFELISSNLSHAQLQNLFQQQFKQVYNANLYTHYMKKLDDNGLLPFVKLQLSQVISDSEMRQYAHFYLTHLELDEIKRKVHTALFNDFCQQLIFGLQRSDHPIYYQRYMMIIDQYHIMSGCGAKHQQILNSIKAVYYQCYLIMRGETAKIKPLIESGLKLPLQSESHVFKLLISYLIKNIRSYHRLAGHFHPTLLVDVFREIQLRRSLFKYSGRDPYYFVEQARLDAFKIVADYQNFLDCKYVLESRITDFVKCFYHLIFNSRLITLYLNNFIAYAIQALSIQFEDTVKLRGDLSEIPDSKKQTAFFVLLQREFFNLFGQSTGLPTLQPNLYACSSRFFGSFSSIHDQLLTRKSLLQITPALRKCDFLHYRVPEQFETIILFDDKYQDIRQYYSQFCVDEAGDANPNELRGAYCKLSMNGRVYFIVDPRIVRSDDFQDFKGDLQLFTPRLFVAFDIDGTLDPCYGREKQYYLRSITPGPIQFSTVVDLCSMAQDYMILTNGAMDRPSLKHYDAEVSQAVRQKPFVELCAQSKSCSPLII